LLLLLGGARGANEKMSAAAPADKLRTSALTDDGVYFFFGSARAETESVYVCARGADS